MGISEFTFLISIFILAVFVGYFVVWSVTPALHTVDVRDQCDFGSDCGRGAGRGQCSAC